MIANSCNSVTFFASFFYKYADIKVKVLFSFKMNSKQFCSFDNFSSLLWGYYSFGFWLLLALKLTIRIIGRGDMIGGGWKNSTKLIVWSLCSSINYNYCFGNKSRRFFCNALWWYQRSNMNFFIWIFFLFQTKNLLLHDWRDEKKNKKTLNLFHVLNTLKKFPRLKSFRLFFDPHRNCRLL